MDSKIYKLLKKIIKTSILKTIYFNFKYFPFKTAVLLPVFISRNVRLRQVKGSVILDGVGFKTAHINIGYGDISIFDSRRSKAIWQVAGTLIFKGTAQIGHGSKISVNTNGVLILGNNFVVSAETTLVASKRIEIGNDCLFSWDTLLMDTDFHYIKDETDQLINAPKEIIIGDHVWIGCRCLILKGAEIPSNSIVAANSTVVRKLKGENNIFAGPENRIVKQKIVWSQYMFKNEAEHSVDS